MVIKSAEGISPTHTTAHLLAAGVAAGWSVRVVEPTGIDIDERGRVQARGWVLDGIDADREALVGRLRGGQASRRQFDASNLDVLVLRVNPLDTGLLAMAQMLAQRGVVVLNEPAGMLRTCHKSWLASLPAEVPRPLTLVTRSAAAAAVFITTLPGAAILKPARCSGGRGVHLLRRGAAHAEVLAAFAATATRGDGYVVVQAYLDEAPAGEKRLLWLEGELIGGYLRNRAPGEFRHNLRLGAIPTPCTVDNDDILAIAALSPHLRRESTWLAGVDVIGGRVVEVNVLNPGGGHLTEALGGVPVGAALVASIGRRIYPQCLPVPVPAK